MDAGVTNRTLDILARVSGHEREALVPDVELVAGLGFDSLKAIELVAEMEDELKIELPDEEIRKMRTVGDLLRAVEGARPTAG